MKTAWKHGRSVVAGVAASLVMTAPAAAAERDGDVTFSKDIAPILQRSCESCHRPGGGAPMSLISYSDVRPWARSIRNRTTAREMPPWFIDKNIGIQHFKDDPSLSDAEIETVAAWVDAGAPRGNPADLPPALEWSASGWSIEQARPRRLVAGRRGIAGRFGHHLRLDAHPFHRRGGAGPHRCRLRSAPGRVRAEVPPEVAQAMSGSFDFALDIPSNDDNVYRDGFYRLEQPARLMTFEPHLHSSGTRMCVEALYPNNAREMLNCADYDHNWVKVYVYEEDAAPLLPAGTVVHLMAWYDNSVVQPQRRRSAELEGVGQSVDRRHVLQSAPTHLPDRGTVRGGSRRAGRQPGLRGVAGSAVATRERKRHEDFSCLLVG